MILNRVNFIFLAFLILFVTSGCGQQFIPFDQELRDRHNLSNHELQSLQYYLEGPITLHRDFTEGDRKIAEGKLITESGIGFLKGLFRWIGKDQRTR